MNGVDKLTIDLLVNIVLTLTAKIKYIDERIEKIEKLIDKEGDIND